MKLLAPKPFTIEGGKRAVLLLHGFTGSTKDVKKLGQFLNKRGYTCHAPMYRGHGVSPEEILRYGAKYWWEDVTSGYHHLKSLGYEEIAVVGISLGGVFTLKVGAEFPVKGVVSMCAPIKRKSSDGLFDRLYKYAEVYKKFEGKDEDTVAAELEDLKNMDRHAITEIQKMIEHTSDEIGEIDTPTLVLQGKLDDKLYQESAPFIFDTVDTEEKEIIWYQNSGHIITLGKEREQVYQDTLTFLDQLDWVASADAVKPSAQAMSL
ncbi:carboxylesterase [Kurthia zopfii]|uniref:Carboxylesterase n=1 Tax=Kurthia zopfii TaxID=1650 RepID=A0A2U3AF52_9BACL|nr:alpha/beta fold hydrolase [Kurthia zopfii]PWI23169.1 carboxylesterase [Kurthia zopfii]TDR41349.1 esterase/lipase [Kurthia zopfii]STX09854.1 Carboxylesterase [Kurthia zopfii]VEI07270.1 Carboxylesterase [Kurthia zopfii]GEK29991.1 carboxylesterase [Kurthia zopfii]